MTKKHSHNYIYIPREELQNYYLVQKLTLKEVAKIYNCSINTIHTHMISYNIPRRNISVSKKGVSVKHSGQFRKGGVPWNKGNSGYSTSKKGMEMPKEVCKRMSYTSHMKGKNIDDIHKSNCQCTVCKAKRGELVGNNHPNWKGGAKISGRKARSKRRGFKDTELFPNPFDKEVEIEWHHVNDEFIIAIPKIIHNVYKGYKQKSFIC